MMISSRSIFFVLIALVSTNYTNATKSMLRSTALDPMERQLDVVKSIGCAFQYDFFGGWCAKETEACSQVYNRAKRIQVTECVSSTAGGSVCASGEAGKPPEFCGDLSFRVTRTVKHETETEEKAFIGKCKGVDNMWPIPNDCYCDLDDATVQEAIDWVDEPLPAPVCAGGAGACPNTPCPLTPSPPTVTPKSPPKEKEQPKVTATTIEQKVGGMNPNL